MWGYIICQPLTYDFNYFFPQGHSLVIFMQYSVYVQCIALIDTAIGFRELLVSTVQDLKRVIKWDCKYLSVKGAFINYHQGGVANKW